MKAQGQGGFTMIEAVVGMAVFVVGFMALSQLVFVQHRTVVGSRERMQATRAAEALMERMAAESFGDLFRKYNEATTDDVGLPNAAPGKHFTVADLHPVPWDPDGKVGEIIFPTVGIGNQEQLREDVVDPELGMPRDLNGDGVIDSLNHAADYEILPCRIEVQWNGIGGPQKVSFVTIYAWR